MAAPAPDQPSTAAPTAPGTHSSPTALPFASDELQAILRSPARILDLVLGERQRLGTSIADGAVLRQLALLLAACTLVATLPYGLIRGWSTTFSIDLLYGGTVRMCWPSLQVFGSCLGGCWRPMQCLTMALLVAALIKLGFAPIVWFLGRRWRTATGSTATSPTSACSRSACFRLERAEPLHRRERAAATHAFVGGRARPLATAGRVRGVAHGPRTRTVRLR